MLVAGSLNSNATAAEANPHEAKQVERGQLVYQKLCAGKWGKTMRSDKRFKLEQLFSCVVAIFNAVIHIFIANVVYLFLTAQRKSRGLAPVDTIQLLGYLCDVHKRTESLIFSCFYREAMEFFIFLRPAEFSRLKYISE